MLFALGAGLWHLLKVQKCSLNLNIVSINMGVLNFATYGDQQLME